MLTSKKPRELYTGWARGGELCCYGPPPLVGGDHVLLGLAAGDHDWANQRAGYGELTNRRAGHTCVQAECRVATERVKPRVTKSCQSPVDVLSIRAQPIRGDYWV